MAGRLSGRPVFFALSRNRGETPHSLTLQLPKRNNEGITISRIYERLEGRAAPREAGQAGKSREVISSGVGVSQKTEDESYRLSVESWVLEAVGVGGRGHRQPSEARYLGVRHGDAATYAGRQDSLPFEEARYHLRAGFNEPGLLEELTESLKELRPVPDVRGDQHH